MIKKNIKKMINERKIATKKLVLVEKIVNYIEDKNNKEYLSILNEQEYIIPTIIDNIENMENVENRFYNFVNKKDDRFKFELFSTFDSCTNNTLFFIRNMINIIGEKKLDKEALMINSKFYDKELYPNRNKITFLCNLNDLIISGNSFFIEDNILMSLESLLNILYNNHKPISSVDDIYLDLLMQLYEVNLVDYAEVVKIFSKKIKSFKCLNYDLNGGKTKCLIKKDEYLALLNK